MDRDPPRPRRDAPPLDRERVGEPSQRCPLREDAVAWLQGELDPAARDAFEAHLPGCDGCVALIDDARRLLHALAQEEVAEEHGPRRVGLPSRRALALAAAVLLAAIVLRLLPESPRAVPVAPALAAVDLGTLGWIEARLRDDGTWDPSALPALGSRQEVGLHAFVLLALARGAAVAPSPEREAGVRRAAGWLLGQQSDDGRIGGALVGGRFDHPVATLALLEAFRVTGDDTLRTGVDRALDVMLIDVDEPGSAFDTGADLWALACLLRARELGWSGASIDAAIAATAADSGVPGLPRDGGLLEQTAFWERALLRPPRADAGRGPRDLYAASASLLAAR